MAAVLEGGPRYVLHERLGSGGMGIVHRGMLVSPAGERPVALKRLLDARAADPVAAERLVDEARLVFRLTHANICQVLDLAVSEAGTFIVMEYVPGLDLRALLGRLAAAGARLGVASALYVAREVARALDYAHRRSDDVGRPLLLVHGDVTPANVLLSDEGEVKLTDFGVARALGAASPGRRVRAGTPGFVAPEAHEPGADHRADVFGLGATLLSSLGVELRAGERPDAAALRALPEVSAELVAIVERSLRQRREERFGSAGELVQALSLELARRHPSFTPSVLASMVRAHRRAVRPRGAPPPLAPLTSLIATTSAATQAASPSSPRPETAGRDDRPAGAATLTDDEQAPRRPGRRPAALALGAATLLGLAGLATWRAVATSEDAAPGPRPSAAPGAVLVAPRAPADAGAPAVDAPPAPGAPASLASAPLAPSTGRAPSRAGATHGRPARARVGYLTVSSTPWGVVYVDGRRLAEQTPVYRVPLAVGAHRVAVFLPDRAEYSPSRRVVLRADEVRTVVFHR